MTQSRLAVCGEIKTLLARDALDRQQRLLYPILLTLYPKPWMFDRSGTFYTGRLYTPYHTLCDLYVAPHTVHQNPTPYDLRPGQIPTCAMLGPDNGGDSQGRPWRGGASGQRARAGPWQSYCPQKASLEFRRGLLFWCNFGGRGGSARVPWRAGEAATKASRKSGGFRA